MDGGKGGNCIVLNLLSYQRIYSNILTSVI